jgi:hypothetical protein
MSRIESSSPVLAGASSLPVWQLELARHSGQTANRRHLWVSWTRATTPWTRLPHA